MLDKLNVGLVQHACTVSKEENLARSVEGIRQCAKEGAKLVVLPELHSGMYFCQTENADTFDQAEPLNGPVFKAISDVAKELGVVVVASIFERRMAGLYHNTALVIEHDGTLAGVYRKMHIPDDPGYYEKYYFAPGDLGFVPIETSVGRLGVLVCWDQWFPEAARLMALAGAQMLIYPTAIGWDVEDDLDEQSRQLCAWQTIQRSHAVANGIPVISVNRCGHEDDPSGDSPGQLFWGNSFAAGEQGEMLVQCSAEQPECLIAELDLSRSERVRRVWPFLRDRRVDAYEGLVERAL